MPATDFVAGLQLGLPWSRQTMDTSQLIPREIKGDTEAQLTIAEHINTRIRKPTTTESSSRHKPLSEIKMGWFDGRSSVSTSGGYVRKRSDRSPSRRSTSGYSTHHSRHSAPSIFDFGSTRGRSSPSVYSTSSRRARPRSGFIQRVVRYIRRLFRDIVNYAKRHPMKVFMLVVVPLITSGVLVKLFSMIGIHLPKHIFGGGSSSRSGGDGGGMASNINGLMNIAKMLM
ncbi:hypothetical protein BDW74DRAFT_182678 [Aspergillus multicolor]|uniref:uncharacterized protein n=1 Tax=Aspergillus multicolor TaxID=41759 RepID=UPI003CCE0841